MTLHKIRLGTNEDGTPQYHFYEDDPGQALVYVGPNITGTVDVPELGKVDVNELFVSVPRGMELAVSDAVGQRFEVEGHPTHDGDEPFVLVPSSESHPGGVPADEASREIAPAAQRALDATTVGTVTSAVPDQVIPTNTQEV